MLAIGLFWLGVVLLVAAILMLFWHSFQHNKLWALISLLLLVPLLVHVFLNWSSLTVRKALYTLILGVLAVLVSISGGALSHLSFLPNNEVVQALEENIAPPKDVPLPNQEQADTAAQSAGEDYDPLLTGSEYEALETKEIVPEGANNKPRVASSTTRYQIISLEERAHAINKRVRIIQNDGSTVEGKLTDILENGVLVESTVSGGSVGLSYSNDQIQSVAVLLAEGEQLYVPPAEEIANGIEDNVNALPDNLDTLDSVEQANQIDEVVSGNVVDVEQSDVELPQEENEVTKEVPEMQPIIDTETELPQEQPKQEINDQVLEQVEEIVDDAVSLDSPLE